jgi:hypothetical protein
MRHRACTHKSKETLRRSRLLSPQQRRESRHSGTAALGQLRAIWVAARWADRLIYLKTVSETRAQLTFVAAGAFALKARSRRRSNAPRPALVAIVLLGTPFGLMGVAVAMLRVAIGRVAIIRFYVEEYLGDDMEQTDNRRTIVSG